MAERDGFAYDHSALDVFETRSTMGAGALKRVRDVREASWRLGPRTIVHAHSSFAGFYVRMSPLPVRRIVYTPHCFAFERQDISKLARAKYRVAESVLARNTDIFAACSLREAQLVRSLRRNSRVIVVPNLAPQRTDLPPTRSESHVRPLIAGSGRLAAQKDPMFFGAAVKSLRASGADVDAIWVGGGDPESADLLRSSGVEVTGWLPRAEALEALSKATVYLHSASWEGFPIAVLEVARLGVPVIVRDIPAFRPYEFPLICATPGQLPDIWDELSLKRAGALAFQADLLEEHSVTAQARALELVYSDSSRGTRWDVR
ncbi:glycosyltransferase family 4 protein [Nocardioides sp. IC4_145]|nr:glycosyltransferase family 4 protein [Nocardioides sp. IC4_145]